MGSLGTSTVMTTIYVLATIVLCLAMIKMTYGKEG